MNSLAFYLSNDLCLRQQQAPPTMAAAMQESIMGGQQHGGSMITSGPMHRMHITAGHFSIYKMFQN